METRDRAPLAALWRRALPALALALAMLLVLAACGGGTTRDEEGGDAAAEPETETTEAPAEGDEGEEGEDEAAADPAAEIPEGLSIAFLPKQVNNPYFDIAATGGEEAVAEFAGEFEQTGPSEASASSQVTYINTLSQQGTDVIAVSANDPNAICGALEEARTAGAKIVTWDSDTDPSCRDVFVNQATAEGIAASQLELIAEQIGGEGQIAILSATANATNQNAWIEMMEAELDSNPDYAGIELVTIAYGDDDDQKSFQETQGLLQSYPDLAGIISPTTVGIAAAARYLSGSEYKGQVALTGLGTPNQMREFVQDGTVTAFALWNPADLGYLAAYTSAALAAGQITGAQGETFEAGKLGEYTIEEGGVVVLGPPTVFNADNIDDFDF